MTKRVHARVARTEAEPQAEPPARRILHAPAPTPASAVAGNVGVRAVQEAAGNRAARRMAGTTTVQRVLPTIPEETEEEVAAELEDDNEHDNEEEHDEQEGEEHGGEEEHEATDLRDEIVSSMEEFEAEMDTLSRPDATAKLQEIIQLCRNYLNLPVNVTPAEDREAAQASLTQATALRNRVAPTWTNAAAFFKTKNTENAFGDSEYTVTAGGYTRYAPVNTLRAPNQVRFSASRSFCYLAPGSAEYNAVMRSQDNQVFVIAVESGNVVFSVAGRRVTASIAPFEGACPFDFDYDPAFGSISHGHVGHALHSLR